MINKRIVEPWMKQKDRLSQEDYDLIQELQMQCVRKDQITLKLELAYKLGASETNVSKDDIQNSNEFLYFDGKQLVGYVGICNFGGASEAFEITGMVHPDYRRQGIFSALYELAIAECKRRNAGSILVLCDRESVSGQNFMKRVGDAVYKYSEFEMYLKEEPDDITGENYRDINFRKATNADAKEVARQNAIYFGDNEEEAREAQEEPTLLPEEEERRGMTIYLALNKEQIIGKVHLQTLEGIGGIYGLGILPENRGKGFGRALLHKSIEKLKAENMKEIMLQVAAENATALNLYKSCGFRETSVMDYYELR